MKHGLVVILLLLSPLTWAEAPKTFRTLFQVNRTYRDKDTYCFGSSGKGQLIISGTFAEGRLESALLENFEKRWPYLTIYRSHALNRAELDQMELYQDRRGNWWVREVTFDDSSLRWILFESAARYSFCPTPQTIRETSPSGASFVFETEGLEQEIWVAESDRLSLSGRREDGEPFSGSLQFTQRDFEF